VTIDLSDPVVIQTVMMKRNEVEDTFDSRCGTAANKQPPARTPALAGSPAAKENTSS